MQLDTAIVLHEELLTYVSLLHQGLKEYPTLTLKCKYTWGYKLGI